MLRSIGIARAPWMIESAMPSWLNWLFDELSHIQQFPRLAVGLVVLATVGGWYLANFLSRTQISNLQSEVALLKSRLATADGPLGPLPSYSLGGSDILIYTNPNWTTQDTAKRVELDWNRLVNVEAYAVLRVRTEGESESTWVQGRIVNITNREVVATTERHRGGKISVRFQLPRATSVKIYSMEVRGEGAGLEGHIELVSTTP